MTEQKSVLDEKKVLKKIREVWKENEDKETLGGWIKRTAREICKPGADIYEEDAMKKPDKDEMGLLVYWVLSGFNKDKARQKWTAKETVKKLCDSSYITIPGMSLKRRCAKAAKLIVERWGE